MNAVVHIGNVLDVLPTLAAGSVNCVVTSLAIIGVVALVIVVFAVAAEWGTDHDHPDVYP